MLLFLMQYSKQKEALMLSCNIPAGIRKLADRNKDLFHGRLAAFANICGLFSFYLLGCKSLSDLVRMCPFTHFVSDLSRAVHEFDGPRFMRRLRASILRRYKGRALDPKDFCYAIDDTDNPKYGKTTFRGGVWHGSQGKYRGQKVLVLVLVDIKRGFAIPLNYAFVAKKDDEDYKPGWQLGLDLFASLLKDGFPALYVTADSWFDCTDFIKGLSKLGLHFAGELKGNRLAKSNPGPRVKWLHFPKIFKEIRRTRLYTRLDSSKIKKRKKRAKCGAEKVVMIKGYKSPIKMLAVYNRRNGKNAFAYYASTDLSLTGARLWELSRARWKIECLFRDLKQFLSFGRLPSGGKEAADLAVCFPFMIYTSLRLDAPEYWGLEKQESIGIMVAKLREKELNRSIALITRKPEHYKVIKLRGRRQRIHKKPVDKPVGKDLSHETITAQGF
jgi:hypothetical protein